MSQINTVEPGGKIQRGLISAMSKRVARLDDPKRFPAGTVPGHADEHGAVYTPRRSRLIRSRVVVMTASHGAPTNPSPATPYPLLKDVTYRVWSEKHDKVLDLDVPHTMRHLPHVSPPVRDTVRVYPAAVHSEVFPPTADSRPFMDAEGFLYEIVEATDPAPPGGGTGSQSEYGGVYIFVLFGECIAPKKC